MPRHPAASAGFFFAGQAVHWLLLIALATSACLLVDNEYLANRELLGLSGRFWFYLALSVPIVHQVFVWFAWRSELCYGPLSKWFGSGAFLIYQVVFFCLFLARPITLVLLATVDHDSLEIPNYLRAVLCLVLSIPAVYTFYSVARYFGFARASGGDHFDERFRSMPMVTSGMFRFSNNAMYTYAFLAFWIIAVAGASWSTFVVVAFSHTYIWVHYFCTERPDMKLIYGG